MFAGAALGQLEANPWLIRHQDAWVEDGHLFLQMEWGARGSLQAQLEAKNEAKTSFGSDVLVEIALQVAQVDFLNRIFCFFFLSPSAFL